MHSEGFVRLVRLLIVFAAAVGFAEEPSVDQLERIRQSEATEVWEPEPKVIDAPPGAVPSDAFSLFDGKNLAAFESIRGGPAAWRVENDTVTVVPGSGDIRSKMSFCDVQLHLEWRSPPVDERLVSQGRGNSGVFLQERYEIQVLDSYRNRSYANGQAASVYKQHIPLVNATRQPGAWQTYDIIFRAPRFDGNDLTHPATFTVLHNGILVQNHVEVRGGTQWIGAPSYEAHGCAPLKLQDHGNPVSFRNIWIREL